EAVDLDRRLGALDHLRDHRVVERRERGEGPGAGSPWRGAGFPYLEPPPWSPDHERHSGNSTHYAGDLPELVGIGIRAPDGVDERACPDVGGEAAGVDRVAERGVAVGPPLARVVVE